MMTYQDLIDNYNSVCEICNRLTLEKAKMQIENELLWAELQRTRELLETERK